MVVVGARWLWVLGGCRCVVGCRRGRPKTQSFPMTPHVTITKPSGWHSAALLCNVFKSKDSYSIVLTVCKVGLAIISMFEYCTLHASSEANLDAFPEKSYTVFELPELLTLYAPKIS